MVKKIHNYLNSVPLLLVASFLLVGVIPFVTAIMLYQLYTNSEYDQAEADAHRMAQVLLRSFERSLEPIDSLLKNFNNSYDPNATPQQIHESLKNFAVPPGVIQLAITDKDGRMIASGLEPPKENRIDLSDREHIRAQLGKDPADGKLFIGKPILGRVSNKWTINLTRPLGDRDGKFVGVIVASYAIGDLIEFYRQLRTDEDMLIALVGNDGIVRARSGRATSFGDDVSKSMAFKQGLRQKGGDYKEKSFIDGVERIGYVVSSDQYPILVEVAYSLNHVKRQLAAFRLSILGTTVALTVGLFFLLLLGGRYLTLQKRLHTKELQTLALQREADVLDAINRVPGICVMYVTPEGPPQVELHTPDPFLAPLCNYLRSDRFRELVGGLSGPRLQKMHLEGSEGALEVDLMVSPLMAIGAENAAQPSSDVVVFAVDQTQRRIEEDKLYQMSKLASLGEMATGLAHEINQPLSVIRLAASNALVGLQRDMKMDYVTAKLERIIQQTVRMTRIIDHMRIFGRKSDELVQPTRPIEAVEGALQILGAHLRLDNIDVSVEMADDVPTVLCRQDQLEQVLINLLQNARDAIAESRSKTGNDFPGHIRVLITLLKREQESDRVQIEIGDNGGGIPPDTLDRIFQPFFTTKAPGKGTGLGLSVSFSIIRDHGGHLSAKNDGQGAIFIITLPVAKKVEPESAATS